MGVGYVCYVEMVQAGNVKIWILDIERILREMLLI